MALRSRLGEAEELSPDCLKRDSMATKRRDTQTASGNSADQRPEELLYARQ
jgi:hypothetical protein